MFTDSVFVKTTTLEYDSAAEKAWFTSYIDFWNEEDNMLSADGGWYESGSEVFFFEGNVHALSEAQESWSDSLYYFRIPGDVLMLGSAQLQDTTRSVAAVSDYLFYEDSLARVTLRHQAAVALWSEEDGQRDTTYFGADTLIYHTVRRCDIPQQEIDDAGARLTTILGDPVNEYRKRAAKEAAEAKAKEEREREEAMGIPRQTSAADSSAPASRESAAASMPSAAGTDSLAVGADSLAVAADSLPSGTDSPAVSVSPPDGADSTTVLPRAAADSLAAGTDSLSFGTDTLHVADSLSAGADSLAIGADSLSVGADSLAVATDSLAVSPDTTRIGYLTGMGNVRIFRRDIQMRSDSVHFCELDSIARFYKNPIIWNEGRRQYTSDSLFVLIRNNAVDRANLMSNAFIAVEEDSLH